MMILLTVLAYFAILFGISHLTSRRADNNTFYRANRRAPWYMVAFGMVGASISGVTFVSVPGMVLTSQMTYLQMCLGFIVGYLAIAFVLLPLYYRLNLTTIYSYLGQRLGERSYLTGASFFLLSKMTGAAVRFYVVCIILQQFVFDPVGIPFLVNVLLMVALIWLYTRRGGIGTLVFTDTFQTVCLFTALIMIIFTVISDLHFTVGEAIEAIAASPMSRIFVFDDWMSPHHFWKQFLSGAFIAIVMTGLDQDMMQKNLTCKSLRDAQVAARCPKRYVQLRYGLRACQSALPRPRRAADDGAGYRTEGRRHAACLYPEQQSLAAAHDALHHRHRRGLVLECRLRTDLTHHELLRGYPPPGRQRAAP